MLTKTKQDKKIFQKDLTTGSYWITTFGCQMNKADSERMAGTLEKMGYTRAVDELNADLVLYNTCTIRDNAVPIWSYTIHALSEIMQNKKFIAF